MKAKTILGRYEESFPHLTEASFLFTNSERASMICPRFWGYQYVQNADTGSRANALSYGTIVHRLLEKVLLSVKDTDHLPTIDELQQAHTDLTPTIIYEEERSEDLEDIMGRIERSLKGWLNNWREIHKEWRVIGVEWDVVAPILESDGSEMRAKIPTVTYRFSDGGTYTRPARIGESVPILGAEGSDHILSLSDEELNIISSAETVSIDSTEMPIMVAGKIDILLQNRNNPKELAVLDHKTTSSLWKYTKSAPYDVQLPTYAYLIEHGNRREELGIDDGAKVVKVFYDLLHSKCPEPPAPLKSGKLSSRAACPSWIYERAIERNGLAIDDYKDVLETLRISDSKYFDIVEREIFPDDVDRLGGELRGIAIRIISMRNAVSMAKDGDSGVLDAYIPRQPHHCVLWGECRFSDKCLANNNIRDTIVSDPVIHWVYEPTKDPQLTEGI